MFYGYLTPGPKVQNSEKEVIHWTFENFVEQKYQGVIVVIILCITKSLLMA